jgi:hypothetical protein
MNRAAFYFLLSDEGQRLLRETAVQPITPDNHLQIAAQLRRQHAPELAHAVLETLLLRERAEAKFSRASEMYFLRPALEQASAEVVATYRAGRFAARGFNWIADLGCGIGGDALALAQAAPVVGVEMDRVRLLMARANVAVYGQDGRFQPLQANLLELPPLPVDAFFADPARRDERGRRIYSVHDYQPPLALLARWLQKTPQAAVKVSPAVDYAEIPAGAEVEFISVNGDVREGVLWFGDLRTGAGRRATLLPGGATMTDTAVTPAIPIIRPQRYLYEPDGAVIRAHLVEQLAEQLGAGKIDADIAYLTAVEAQATPFARCYQVEDTLPFQLKQLRRYLRERQIGQVTIKKRGSPLDPETLRRQLRLSGAEARTLFLTHVAGEAVVIIGQVVSK